MKRNKEIKISLNDIEFALLNDYVLKAGYYSREEYMRTVLLNKVPREQPPIDYKKLINEFGKATLI